MKYTEKFFVIILISFIGEILNYFIPLPIPGSIYGFLILLILLLLKVIKVDYIKPVTDFLLSVMPLTFIAPGVAVITIADELKSIAIPFILTATVSTAVVMGVVAKIVDFVIKKKSEGEKENV